MHEVVRILCVDDEPNVLKSLKRVFLDEDYQILTANSGYAGLKILEDKYPVQVIIADYRMPGMNGVNFLREACKQWPETMRIVLSGYADTATLGAAIAEGDIFRFIAKPWDDDELRGTVSRALEAYCLRWKNIELAG